MDPTGASVAPSRHDPDNCALFRPFPIPRNRLSRPFRLLLPLNPFCPAARRGDDREPRLHNCGRHEDSTDNNMDDTLLMDDDSPVADTCEHSPPSAAPIEIDESTNQSVAMLEVDENTSQSMAEVAVAEKGKDDEAESPTTPFLFRLTSTFSARRQQGRQQASSFSTPLSRSATVSSFPYFGAALGEDQDSSLTFSPSPQFRRPPQVKRLRGHDLNRSSSAASFMSSVAEESDCKEDEPSPKRRQQSALPRSVSDAPSLSRSMSESIMRACEVRVSTANFTADTARPLSLPTVPSAVSKHADLDTIDCHTLAKLIRGEFSSTVNSFRIIDARYVYEFEGGHVSGAENFGSWDKSAFLSVFLPVDLKPLTAGSHEDKCGGGGRKTDILVFHCEFSSARGPALLRDLRKRDRCLNVEAYPALHYPECYLLHNGYKEFFENYPDLCDPRSYVPMKDPGFAGDEKLFRKKSKTWAASGLGGGGGGRPTKGTKLSRTDRTFL